MGLGFGIRLRGFKFDTGKFLKSTDLAAQAAVRHAAREWLRAAIVRVPVWTGQALGSLKYAKGRSGPSAGLFLGQYLKVAIPITPVAYVPGKDAQTGGRQARFSFSSYRHQYRFSFQSDVIYYVIQDVMNIGISPRAPWLSMLFGAEAFKVALREEMKIRLPRINDFLLDLEDKDTGSKQTLSGDQL